MQNHYNLIYREEEREMIPLCLDQEVGMTPWSPLARGFLTGNRTRDGEHPTPRARTDEFAHRLYYHEEDFAIVERVIEVAGKRGATPAQVALAWLLARAPVVCPIPGTGSLAHLEENAAAASLELSEEELAELG
jgi:aryl-alcohol dehydrogenase (NADP+)